MDVGDSGSESVLVEVAEDVVYWSRRRRWLLPRLPRLVPLHILPRPLHSGRLFLPIRAQGRLARPISPLMT